MKKNIKNITRKVFCVLLYGFAIIGFIFASVYVLMHFHLTDVKGSIDSRNAYFNANTLHKKFIYTPKIINTTAYAKSSRLDSFTACQIMTISSILPDNGKMILDAYVYTKSSIIAEKMVKAVLLVTQSNTFLQDKIKKCDTFSDNFVNNLITPSNQNIFDWISSSEWQTLRDGLIKDKDVIKQVSRDSGVPERIIISSMISEQFRFFTSNRESFKQYFEPLKILGNGTKFSYGVAGVKIETAKEIEQNLKDVNNKFYLGSNYEHIFDYKTEDTDTERLARLTDNKNHYYSYLYTAIFLKEIIHQWDQAGYNIGDRPEVLATLFNIGFVKSVPKENPEVGGSNIVINDRTYTFGGLAYEFYYSGEISDIFPFDVVQ